MEGVRGEAGPFCYLLPLAEICGPNGSQLAIVLRPNIEMSLSVFSSA